MQGRVESTPFQGVVGTRQSTRSAQSAVESTPFQGVVGTSSFLQGKASAAESILLRKGG